MGMTRRWFLRATATAAVAVTAARMLPVSALPTTGPLYDTLYDRLLTWLRVEFNTYVRAQRRNPARIRVGSAVYRTYEAALEANMRFVSSAYPDAVLFKGCPMIEDASIGPWMIEMQA